MWKLTVYFKLAFSFEEYYWLYFHLVLSLNLKQAPTRCRDRDCNEMSAMYSPAWCSPPENKFQLQKALFNGIIENVKQWKPLNMITLGQRESDNIHRMITISDCLLTQSTQTCWFFGTWSIWDTLITLSKW